MLADVLLVPGGQSVGDDVNQGRQPLMLDQLILGGDGQLGQRAFVAAGAHHAAQQVALLGGGRLGAGVAGGYRLLDFCHSSFSSR